MLSQVFLGWSRGQRRGVVYGCRRRIKRELFLLYSLTEERLDGASYEIRRGNRGMVEGIPDDAGELSRWTRAWYSRGGRVWECVVRVR